MVEGPAERNAVATMSEALDDITFIALQCLDLPLLAAILSQCNLFIGNDSGITHLAAALGVPTVALFGPTDPYFWGPRGKTVFIAREDIKHGTGWKWVSADSVREAALNFLDKS
jgi:ADP-heptose:LPS heptosyltransferase